MEREGAREQGDMVATADMERAALPTCISTPRDGGSPSPLSRYPSAVESIVVAAEDQDGEREIRQAQSDDLFPNSAVPAEVQVFLFHQQRACIILGDYFIGMPFDQNRAPAGDATETRLES